MNINKVIGIHGKTKESDLRNRQVLDGVRKTYLVAQQSLPTVLRGAIEKMRLARAAVGLTAEPVDPDAFREVLFETAFKDTPAIAQILKDPTLIHDENNKWGDGPRRLAAQLTGVALHETLSSLGSMLYGAKGADAKQFADAINTVARDVRKSLAYMAPVPNSFRMADESNHRAHHFMGEVIERYDPASWQPGMSPITMEHMKELIQAKYAGDRGSFRALADQYRMKGYGVDPSFIEQIPERVEDAPLNKRWLDAFYNKHDPVDKSQFPDISEDVPPSVRRDVYQLIDGYPVGAYAEDGSTPPGVAAWARQQDAKLAATKAAMMERQAALDAKLEVKPPAEGVPQNAGQSSPQRNTSGKAQGGGKPQGGRQ